MKRNKPLKRKTPMKRGGPLRKVSTKQAKKLRNYAKERLDYYKDHPDCERCGENGEHLHHKRGRGIYLDDPAYFCVLCAECHAFIHDNSKLARENGWIID